MLVAIFAGLGFGGFEFAGRGFAKEFRQGSMPLGDPESETMARLQQDIEFLASDQLKGRGVGSEEIAQAAEFIAERFASLGLRTDLFDQTPFQSLSVDTSYQIGDPQKNQVSIQRADGKQWSLSLGDGFNPLSVGNSGSVSAPVVFVGYGIAAPQVNFNEYSGVSVQGKIVIVLRKEPRLGQPNNPLGKRSPTPNAYFSTKMLAASTQGAAGVIFVNDQGTAALIDKESPGKGMHSILQVNEAGKGSHQAELPAVSVSRELIDQILQSSLGRSLAEIEASIDRDFRPQSAELPGVTASITTDLKTTQVMARNVLAELPGAGSLANETVIVGAHYDHVGMGGIGSLAPGTVAVHNGADDNASGTAALLEIARRLSEMKSGERRRLVFIAFTGEERGLLGSAFYVRNPRYALSDTVAMLNLDMVGRLKGNVLSVYGTGTAAGFDSLIEQLNQSNGFDLDKQPSGFGPSDHQSFFEKQIPVLHFFTGLHNDYHRPSDDFHKINLKGLARITDMVTEATRSIATAPHRPQYQSTGRGRGIRTQLGAYLGVKLKLIDRRVVVTEVVPGGPAAQAGLTPHDVLLEVDGDELISIQTMLDQLKIRSGGDTMRLKILRDQQPRQVDVKLEETK